MPILRPLSYTLEPIFGVGSVAGVWGAPDPGTGGRFVWEIWRTDFGNQLAGSYATLSGRGPGVPFQTRPDGAHSGRHIGRVD